MPWPSTSRQSRGYGRSWELVRERVLVRDSHLCQACARKGQLRVGNQVHHRKPKARGGSDDMSNLETLCVDCHEAAHAEANGHAVARRYRVALDGTLIEC
jgi:Restriction endonuclease